MGKAVHHKGAHAWALPAEVPQVGMSQTPPRETSEEEPTGPLWTGEHFPLHTTKDGERSAHVDWPGAGQRGRQRGGPFRGGRGAAACRTERQGESSAIGPAKAGDDEAGKTPWGRDQHGIQCTYTYICTCICVYIYMCTHIYIYTYTYIHIHIHIHVHTLIYFIYSYTHILILCSNMHIHICTHTCIHRERERCAN